MEREDNFMGVLDTSNIVASILVQHDGQCMILIDSGLFSSTSMLSYPSFHFYFILFFYIPRLKSFGARPHGRLYMLVGTCFM